MLTLFSAAQVETGLSAGQGISLKSRPRKAILLVQRENEENVWKFDTCQQRRHNSRK
jgi:hypothetical protein